MPVPPPSPLPPPVPSSSDPEPTAASLAPPPLTHTRRGFLRAAAGFTARTWERVLGLLTLWVALAALSAVPLLHFFSLGYLLKASAAVAESGRFRDGFPALGAFARIGTVVAGVWLWLLPLRLVHDLWRDVAQIHPGGPREAELRVVLSVLAAVIAVHLLWALAQGGRFRHFFVPRPLAFLDWLVSRGRWTKLRRLLREMRPGLDLPRLWWLGLRASIGALAWLLPSVALLFAGAGAQHEAAAFLLSLAGGIALATAALFLPFAQCRFAQTGRFRDLFAAGEIRSFFQRAPLAFWTALAAVLLFSLPLYLLKIELAPREVAWLSGLVFVAFLYPARLLVGWSLARARQREGKRHWTLRYAATGAILPVLALYALVVWLSQYLSWHGSFGLVDQHAFMIPAPMLGL